MTCGAILNGFERRRNSDHELALASVQQRGGSGIELQLEMVGADFHPAVEIEAVGGETLNAGIEGKIVAFFFPGVLDQPIEKCGAEPAGAIGVMRDQIVDVESATGEKEIED